MEQARELLIMYMKKLMPTGYTADELRRATPILFLAVMAAASGKVDPHLHSVLHSETLQAYANTVVLSQKSLELVQSMIVTSPWSFTPVKFAQLKFYEYIHMAATMALDIGIGENPRRSRVGPSHPNNVPLISELNLQIRTPSMDAELLDTENRRTFLTCYCLSAG